MAGYRDDLEAAKLRIELLEERLAERDAELAAQQRPRPRPPGPVHWIRIRFAVLGAIGGIAGVVMMCAQSPGARPLQGPLQGPLEPPLEQPMERASLVAPPDVPDVWPSGPRPQHCEPRHGYSSLEELPSRAAIVTFDRCLGCECCLPGELLPRDTTTIDACRSCSMNETLKRAGLTVSESHGPAPRGIQAIRNTLTFNLARPASFFAVVFRPGSLVLFPEEPRVGTVVVKGRDTEGRIADVARAEYPVLVERTLAGAHASRERFLVVEACSSAPLVSVQVWSSELNMHLTDLAFDSAL